MEAVSGQVLLTEFSCAPDTVLDLATGSCVAATCTHSCEQEGQ